MLLQLFDALLSLSIVSTAFQARTTSPRGGRMSSRMTRVMHKLRKDVNGSESGSTGATVSESSLPLLVGEIGLQKQVILRVIDARAF